MLSRDLQVSPFLKFILIEDTVTTLGDVIFRTLLKHHEGRKDCNVHFFVFEGNFKSVRSKHPNCIHHDFTTDLRNWMGQSCDLKNEISKLDDNCVVVVDSLAQVLYRYGLLETFRIFNELNNNSNVRQILTVLHTDLLEEKEQIVQYFEHIATLSMEILPKNRISYTLKHSRRKVKKDIEEYYFDVGGRFTTSSISKNLQDVKQDPGNINPEEIATFKISLSEKDKESRSNLVLPYLPKDGDSSGGKIHYTFDGVDDWDEEDPDDDLDI